MSVSLRGNPIAGYVYNGDGQPVKKVVGGEAMVDVSNYYQRNTTTGEATSYYYHGERLVA